MKLQIVAVGHRQPDWVAAGCAEYLKRMPRELPASVVEIKPEPRGSKTREQLLAAEKARIRDVLPASCRLIVLDEKGDDLTTLQLARRLETWMQDGRDCVLLIGGADGIDEELKRQASDKLRLSSLTLPHGMARLLLCEQLYRAVSVLKNHPYHREGCAMRIYLASRSPRRRELLTQIGIEFDTLLFRAGQRTDDEVDETPQPGESAVVYVERIARAKAAHGARLMTTRRLLPRPILSADTTLEVDGRIIGKPRDQDDAIAILESLSGRTHRVLTGVAVHDRGQTEYVLSTSEVRFRSLDAEEIRAYVATGEPMDKAGAYGIQGRAGLFVEYIAGSYTGIMGLPYGKSFKMI